MLRLGTFEWSYDSLHQQHTQSTNYQWPHISLNTILPSYYTRCGNELFHDWTRECIPKYLFSKVAHMLALYMLECHIQGVYRYDTMAEVPIHDYEYHQSKAQPIPP